MEALGKFPFLGSIIPIHYTAKNRKSKILRKFKVLGISGCVGYGFVIRYLTCVRKRTESAESAVKPSTEGLANGAE